MWVIFFFPLAFAGDPPERFYGSRAPRSTLPCVQTELRRGRGGGNWGGRGGFRVCNPPRGEPQNRRGLRGPDGKGSTARLEDAKPPAERAGVSAAPGKNCVGGGGGPGAAPGGAEPRNARGAAPPAAERCPPPSPLPAPLPSVGLRAAVNQGKFEASAAPSCSFWVLFGLSPRYPGPGGARGVDRGSSLQEPSRGKNSKVETFCYQLPMKLFRELSPAGRMAPAVPPADFPAS